MVEVGVKNYSFSVLTTPRPGIVQHYRGVIFNAIRVSDKIIIASGYGNLRSLSRSKEILIAINRQMILLNQNIL